MEHTKTYQEFKKNGNTKFVRYSEGAEMYHMSYFSCSYNAKRGHLLNFFRKCPLSNTIFNFSD